jgi:predicted AAA+ superfamily ATPase
MYRKALKDLEAWMHRKSRKPLIIRGARQVGKSYLAREFAKLQGLKCLEINFERNPEDIALFCPSTMKEIQTLLELRFKTDLSSPEKCLLFLDEVQSAPQILSKLRYFYEDWPDLYVIAAGSLLEFALSELDHSLPVGRIEYLFLGPMTFEEFLTAQQESQLVEYLETFQLGQLGSAVPEFIHERLIQFLRQYFTVGGMPAVVQEWITSKSLLECDRIQTNLLLTYQEDFNKYRKRIPLDRLQLLFKAIPREVGKKLKFSRIGPDERAQALSKALQALTYARVVTQIYHTAANGLPLGAEVNLKTFKVIFIDIGLLSKSLDFSYSQMKPDEDLIRVNEGALAEQFVGQQLLELRRSYEPPELYYWTREKAGSMAEVDYLVPHQGKVIPIEVKAGKSGKLKSLRIFLNEKKLHLGVRFSSDYPSREDELIHLPLYLIGQMERLLD